MSDLVLPGWVIWLFVALGASSNLARSVTRRGLTCGNCSFSDGRCGLAVSAMGEAGGYGGVVGSMVTGEQHQVSTDSAASSPTIVLVDTSSAATVERVARALHAVGDDLEQRGQ